MGGDDEEMMLPAEGDGSKMIKDLRTLPETARIELLIATETWCDQRCR